MRGLLLKLSALAADSETAIRVISYFDALVESRATLVEVVRSAAGIAECVVGVELDGVPALRRGPDGKPATGPTAITAEATIGEYGRVWLEREGDPRPMDDLVLERCAITLR